MDRIRVNRLQMAVAAFFAIIAALMLITPHTFRFFIDLPIERHPFVWGLLFLLGSLGLFAIITMYVSQRLAALIDLAASGLLVVLAAGFVRSAMWINSLTYAMLALGLALAALINARSLSSTPTCVAI